MEEISTDMKITMRANTNTQKRRVLGLTEGRKKGERGGGGEGRFRRLTLESTRKIGGGAKFPMSKEEEELVKKQRLFGTEKDP